MSTCTLPAGLPPVTTQSDFYLGQPGAMVKLPKPDSGLGFTVGRGEVAHALSSGGITTTRRGRAKRIYSLGYTALSADTADVLESFYLGARGLGPYALVDPAYRNQMSTYSSTMNAPTGLNGAWSAALGDTQPFLDGTVAPPFAGSSVLRWPTPVAGHILLEGTQPVAASFVPSWTYGVPYLPDQVAVVSLWIKSGAGNITNVHLYALGLARAGWDAVSQVNVAMPTVTSTWQQVSLVVPVNSWTQATGPIIAPAIFAPAACPDLLIAGAQITYGFASAIPWVTGLGVPRVTFSAGIGGGQNVYWRRNEAYTLSEA